MLYWGEYRACFFNCNHLYHCRGKYLIWVQGLVAMLFSKKKCQDGFLFQSIHGTDTSSVGVTGINVNWFKYALKHVFMLSIAKGMGRRIDAGFQASILPASVLDIIVTSKIQAERELLEGCPFYPSFLGFSLLRFMYEELWVSKSCWFDWQADNALNKPGWGQQVQQFLY